MKLLEVGADEAERWERRKKKKNPDQGFSTYEDATIRSVLNMQFSDLACSSGF